MDPQQVANTGVSIEWLWKAFVAVLAFFGVNALNRLTRLERNVQSTEAADKQRAELRGEVAELRADLRRLNQKQDTQHLAMLERLDRLVSRS